MLTPLLENEILYFKKSIKLNTGLNKQIFTQIAIHSKLENHNEMACDESFVREKDLRQVNPSLHRQ